jgi:signal transduction histidine kinase
MLSSTYQEENSQDMIEIIKQNWMDNHVEKPSDIKSESQERFVNIQISVIDTGVGMSEEGVKKLFIDFNKLDENSQRNKQGTGLGLSICKKIIEQMGGSVSVKSQVGVGSEFVINVKTKCRVKKCELIDEINQAQGDEPFVFIQKGCFDEE